MPTPTMTDDEKAALFADGTVTVGELTKRYCISSAAAYRLMESGDLPYTHRGRIRLIPIRAVNAMLAKGLVTGPAE